MRLAASLEKNLALPWVAGVGGCLDSGSKAINTWYYFYLIRRPDTGVVDMLASTSSTAPVMPANYTQKRRLPGAIRTSGAGVNVAFKQIGRRTLFVNAVQDVNGATIGTSATLHTVTVPPLTGTEVLGRTAITAPVGTPAVVLLSSLDEADAAPNAPVGNATVFANPGGTSQFVAIPNIRTVGGQIRSRSSIAGTTFYWNTIGFEDLGA